MAGGSEAVAHSSVSWGRSRPNLAPASALAAAEAQGAQAISKDTCLRELAAMAPAPAASPFRVRPSAPAPGSRAGAATDGGRPDLAALLRGLRLHCQAGALELGELCTVSRQLLALGLRAGEEGRRSWAPHGSAVASPAAAPAAAELRPLLAALAESAAEHLEAGAEPGPEVEAEARAGPNNSGSGNGSSNGGGSDAGDGAVLLHNLAKLGADVAPSSRLAEAVAAAGLAQGLAAALAPRALQDLVWALGKLGPAARRLPAVRQLVRQLERRLAEPGLLHGMNSVGLSMLVYGMGKIGLPYSAPLAAAAVCGAVAAAVAAPECPPQAVSNMAWGLARSLGGGVRDTDMPAAPPPPPPPGPPRPPVASAARTGAAPTAAGPAALTRPRPGPGRPPLPSLPPPAVGIAAAAAAAALAAAATPLLSAGALKPREAANLLGGLAALAILPTPPAPPPSSPYLQPPSPYTTASAPPTTAASALPWIAPLLAASTAYVASRVDELGPQDVAELLYTYGTFAAAADASCAAAAAASGAVQRGYGSGGQERSELAWMAAAALGADGGSAQAGGGAGAGDWGRALARLEARLVHTLPRAAPYQVATAVWAFGHLAQHHRPSQLLEALEGALAGPAEAHTGPGPHRGPTARANSSPRPDGGAAWGEAWADALPGSQLARMAWGLARLRWEPRAGALQGLSAAAGRRAADMDPHALLLTLASLAALRCPRHASADALAARLGPHLPSLEPPRLALALWAAGRLVEAAGGEVGHDMALLRMLSSARGPLVACLPRMGPRGVAMAAWAFDAAGANPGEAVLGAVWERAAAAAPRMGGRGLAMLAGAMARFRCRNPRALAALVAAAKARMAAAIGAAGVGGRAAALGGEEVGVWMSGLVCGLGRLGVRDPEVLEVACRLVPPLLAGGRLGPREAVPLMWGLAAMSRCDGVGSAAAAAAFDADAAGLAVPPGGAGSGGSVAAAFGGGCPPEVVLALASVVEQALGEDVLEAAAARSSATVAAASVRSSRPHPSRQGQAQAETQAQAQAQPRPKPGMDAGLLCMYVFACVGLRHRPRPVLLQAACALLLPRLRALSSHTLCELAWSLAVLLPPPPGAPSAADTMLPTLAARGAAAAELEGAVAAGDEALWAAVAQLCDPAQRRRKALRKSGGRAAGRAANGGASADAGAGLTGEEEAGSVGTAVEPTAPTEAVEGDGRGRASLPQPRRYGAPEGPTVAATVAAGVAVTTEAAAPPAWPGQVRLSLPERLFRLATLPQGRRQRRRMRDAEVVAELEAAAEGVGEAAVNQAVAAAPAATQEAGKAKAKQALAQTDAASPAAAKAAVAAAKPSPKQDGAKQPSAAPHQASPPAPQHPPTPLAKSVAPIYPALTTATTTTTAAAAPPRLAASRRLLAAALAALGRRLCLQRSELLSLASLVRVTWAMAVTRMYAPRIFRYCAARAISASTAPLERRPALLRALVEARGLIARERPSAWRRLSLLRRWRRRQAAGARWRLSAAELLAAAPPGMARAVLRCQAALEAAADDANLPLTWHTTYDGVRHGVVRLGPRTAYALLLVPPWEKALASSAPGAAPALPSRSLLAGAEVSLRLMRLRGWAATVIDVEGWLAAPPAVRKAQMVELYGIMMAEAKERAAAAAAARAAAIAAGAAPEAVAVRGGNRGGGSGKGKPQGVAKGKGKVLASGKGKKQGAMHQAGGKQK
ncbi:hypothetical protein HYH03_010752 [Edaphochlamys debaryana]|uniref:RAP domain-containing protein n=1 Tax=Edaphochlamys debaryana TaxID=47281 RepID=A0A835XVC4_9CHLO|nr:hypothetical protein HYH03_010752 [Edaphochlamys debaryana]|eukprot:KAG2490831.1 hypothetical protein HYH03_010752 [Edaphochlamys debaryana]